MRRRQKKTLYPDVLCSTNFLTGVGKKNLRNLSRSLNKQDCWQDLGKILAPCVASSWFSLIKDSAHYHYGKPSRSLFSVSGQDRDRDIARKRKHFYPPDYDILFLQRLRIRWKLHIHDDAHDTITSFPFISTRSNATDYRHIRKKKVTSIVERTLWKIWNG